jgi:hypothetical protein
VLSCYLIILSSYFSSDTVIVREARSAPATVVCETVRKQRPSGPRLNYGDLVRITKGEYKNDIGKPIPSRVRDSMVGSQSNCMFVGTATFERSLPGGWSEVRRLGPEGPPIFWVQTDYLTTKPRTAQPKKKRRKLSAKQFESFFTDSVDECFRYVKVGHGVL